MKIIRHLTPTGPAYAALQPDGSARAIAGDILGDFKVTDNVVKPGKLLAPLVPVNILAIGLNYKKHADEGGKGVPAQPMPFMKSPQLAPESRRPRLRSRRRWPAPRWTTSASWPWSSARSARTPLKANALDFVLAYTCANDVSARDWQIKWGGGQTVSEQELRHLLPARAGDHDARRNSESE